MKERVNKLDKEKTTVPRITKELDGYVGFANFPNQVYRKAIKKGFEFTLMVVGKYWCTFRGFDVIYIVYLFLWRYKTRPVFNKQALILGTNRFDCVCTKNFKHFVIFVRRSTQVCTNLKLERMSISGEFMDDLEKKRTRHFVTRMINNLVGDINYGSCGGD